MRPRHLAGARAHYGRATDTNAANQAKNHQRRPVPGKGASHGGNRVEHCHDAKCFPATDSLAEYACRHRADHGTQQTDEYG
jgi:hypothetical protein